MPAQRFVERIRTDVVLQPGGVEFGQVDFGARVIRLIDFCGQLPLAGRPGRR